MDQTRRQFIRSGLLLAAPAIVRAASMELKIGLTPVILADQAAFLARWATYLEQRIDAKVSFVARTEYQLVLDQLFQREVHVAWLCGYPYIQHQARLSMLAVPLSQNAPTYRSYLIRPRESSISGWQDLNGRVLAYADRLSNSGWLVAQAQLKKVGISPQDLRKSFFAHGHKHVAESVASHLADAGAIDGYLWDTMHKQKMQAALDTEVVWRSTAFGFPPLVNLRGEETDVHRHLQGTLLDMHRDSQGQSLLADLNLDGFVAGDPSRYESIRVMAQDVANSGLID